MTPSQYARSIGPLVSVQRPGGPPLLFPKPRSGRGRRRRAAVGAERKPLYVGLSSVAISKSFNIKGAAQNAAAQLPSLFAKHLRAD